MNNWLKKYRIPSLKIPNIEYLISKNTEYLIREKKEFDLDISGFCFFEISYSILLGYIIAEITQVSSQSRQR